MTDAVLISVSDAIATITFNRPKTLNALDRDLVEGLVAATAQAAADESVRCVVLEGAGGHFMSGGDLRYFAENFGGTPEERKRQFHAFIGIFHQAVVAMREMPKPVIAKVRGAAAGGGFSLMLATDLAIAADTAFFTVAYSLIGTSPDGGSTWALPRLVGLRKAMELALLADRFDAATAERLGVVNRAVPESELDGTVAKLAARLAAGPTQAYAATKRLLVRSNHSPLADQLEAEARSFGDCAATEDFPEGLAAFLEKRKPDFSGH